MNYKKYIVSTLLMLGVYTSVGAVSTAQLDKWHAGLDLYCNWYMSQLLQGVVHKTDQKKFDVQCARIAQNSDRLITDPFILELVREQLTLRGLSHVEQIIILKGGPDVIGADLAAVFNGYCFIWPQFIDVIKKVTNQLAQNLGREVVLEDVQTVQKLTTQLTEEQNRVLAPDIEAFFFCKFIIRHEAGHLINGDIEKRTASLLYKDIPTILVYNFLAMVGAKMLVESIVGDSPSKNVARILTRCLLIYARNITAVSHTIQRSVACSLPQEIDADIQAAACCTDADELRLVVQYWQRYQETLTKSLAEWTAKYKELSSQGRFAFTRWLLAKAPHMLPVYWPFLFYLWCSAHKDVDWAKDQRAIAKMDPSHPTPLHRIEICQQALQKLEQNA